MSLVDTAFFGGFSLTGGSVGGNDFRELFRGVLFVGKVYEISSYRT